MSAAPLTIPAARCYWGVLPADSKRLDASARRYRFEAVLPVPVESLHTADLDLPDGRVLMVGIERAELAALIGAASTPPLSAHPHALPPTLGDGIALSPEQLASLELLHGEFEPAPSRQRRRRVTLVLVAAPLVAAMIIIIGALTEAAAHRSAEAQAREQANKLADAAVPLPPGAQWLPPTLRLEQELRRARQAANGAGPEADLVPVLDALWQVWPDDVRIQIDTIGLDAGRLVLRGRVPDAESAQQLAASLSQLPVPTGPWRAQPMNVPKVGSDAVSVLLAFAPPEEAQP